MMLEEEVKVDTEEKRTRNGTHLLVNIHRLTHGQIIKVIKQYLCTFRYNKVLCKILKPTRKEQLPVVGYSICSLKSTAHGHGFQFIAYDGQTYDIC